MFKPEILLDKQPIIIDDNDVNITEFKSNIFGINPSHTFILNNSEIWYKNKYKYLILQSKNGSSNILLCNPNYVDNKTNKPIESENTEIVEVQLSEGQVLVLPFNWLYYVQNSTVDCIGIHDYITYFLP